MYEKTAASDPTTFDVFWSKATVPIKRKACREYLRLWSLAAVQGSRQEFEDEFNYQESHNKKRRSGADCETAVAASHPANGVEESQAASASAIGVDEQQPENAQRCASVYIKDEDMRDNGQHL